MSSQVNRRQFLRDSAAGAGAVVLAGQGTADAERGQVGRLRVEKTTVEYAESLLGTDVPAPRLSWRLATRKADDRNVTQSAYQIVVSAGRDEVWDSGRVVSERSVGVPYGGAALRPRTRYHWRVRVWDGDRPSEWSPTGWWETGMLGEPWRASWIGAPAPAAPPGFEGTSWIWSPGASTGHAPAGPRWFRAGLDLTGPAGEVSAATVVATADDDFTLYLGGQRILHAPERADGWKTALTADVTEQVRAAGTGLVLAALATNRGAGTVNPGGLLVRLLVEFDGGDRRELVTGPGWRVSDTESPGWADPDFDDSGWAAAAVLAPYGQGPWGEEVTVVAPERPAPLLRREFTVTKPVRAARLYLSGLAYYEAELNGRRVGDQVLDPGFTAYDRTVLYAVHDVTASVHTGANAIGVSLGRGFYGMLTPNVWNWHRPSWHGEPQLLAQLEIEHVDGSSTTVGTDESWTMTDGPTRSNSLYAGETYDARLAPGGWSRPGFDDRAWLPAVARDAPAGRVRAQQHEPIRVIATITPAAIAEPLPGVYTVDMGRTMAGWTKLSVRAAAGTRISLRHGEKLNADGTVAVDNGNVYSSRQQTDEYVCAGTGTETWEPRFGYHGFRYVQVTGLPSRPRPSDVLGRLVHSDVAETGVFRCSEPLFERFDRMMRRTLRNNFHGIPTDTPLYEKNGWTGDAQLGAPTMAYAFGMARLFTKWIGDLADSERAPGQLPVIVPSGGWGYRELAPAPEWTTVFPFLAHEMYRWYGDERLAADHWPELTGYLDWEIGRLEHGLAVTALGDYLPPGYPGGIPPEDTRLTATAYLHRALLHTAELADRLGQPDIASRYRSVAGECKNALNATFLDPAAGHYRTAKDPEYRQTSNAIPLAFGLVPPGAEASVVASLVADIRARGGHLNTGALGTSVLLPVLTAHGHAELAHTIAVQREYPSWAYWLDNGADTMWERWDLGARSRDHYFQGTVTQWLYENVAGLRPGDEGYRRFVVRPDARAGVSWARAELETVRGPAGAGWSLVDGRLLLEVTVPVGSTAEVHVPAAAVADVVSPDAVEFVRAEPGFVVLRAGSGRWRFVSGTPGS
ncbi:family 78 glycoside hydrolase catalytic domain [Amycolatopsis nigrescens]|uniref:family 78 glycoside hydrolase catalytic domain n=1 Tax=Amycolatopsis nigrescens TaxID=381445 RepID=UPI000374EAB3|nr:family 78 glycoside hydrolase catalytic domain [Amycolatopsis nigrescens]